MKMVIRLMQLQKICTLGILRYSYRGKGCFMSMKEKIQIILFVVVMLAYMAAAVVHEHKKFEVWQYEIPVELREREEWLIW